MKNHIIILHTATKNSKRLNFGKKIFWSLFCEKEERKGMISKKIRRKKFVQCFTFIWSFVVFLFVIKYFIRR